ncbi:class III lanthionine synthetase LanKC N-terminal domain-containing protein [Thermosipho affectus]
MLFYVLFGSNENKLEYDYAEILPEKYKRMLSKDNFWYFLYLNEFPEQGWKIHISAKLDNAERILRIVSEYLIKNKISFKFAKSKKILYVCKW